MKNKEIKIRDVLGIYLKHLLAYKWIVLTLISIVIIVESLNLIVPWYGKKIFDVMYDLGPTSGALTEIKYLILIIFGLEVLRWGLWRIFGFSTGKLMPKISKDLKDSAFNKLIYHSHKFFTENFSGALVRKVNRFSRAFYELWDVLMFNYLQIVVVLVGVFIGLFSFVPNLAWIFMFWVIFFVFFNYLGSKWKLKIDVKRAAADSVATGVLSDDITNIATIQIFATEKQEAGRFSKTLDVFRNLSTRSWYRAEYIIAIQGAMIIGLNVYFLLYGAEKWQQGVITIGDLTLLQAYMLIIFSKLWNIGSAMRNTYEAFADAKEMTEIFMLPYEVKDLPGAKKLKITEGEVEFDNVSFAYNMTNEVLKDLNLKIKPKEKVAFVGPSGAGKSTITKLMLRFYDLTAGKIYIDEQDISHLTQRSLREKIAYVPQDPIMFHRSLFDNIRYGRQSATKEEVIAAAKKAHCHEFIENFPKKYDTLVGERGVKLSGGERQRVAIARAILKNASILILDEATSSLDSESERYIQDALGVLMRNKTTIVIAHRLSTIMKMDRIVVIDKGVVVDQGTHEELIKKGGMYKKHWDIQVGGFIQ